MPHDFDGCIDRFLGQDIYRHELVTNSKLTEEEKILLDRPLSIDELDDSVKKLNLKSAPGIDGVSDEFICKFWTFFREPLYRYVTHCIATGKLTETFNTAIIRLIPKKGDIRQFKN